MLRVRRVAAGIALGAVTLLSPPFLTPSSGVASASSRPADLTLPRSADLLSSPSGNLLPGAADPDATRVWSVWQSDGTAWLAAAADVSPPDGSVIGWRFSAAPDRASSESPGGDLPSFQGVCGDAAGSGHKRVVVAVDFGDADTDAYPGDRPPAQGVLRCVTGAENATAAQLLASAAKVRVDGQGGVVAVNDYPARENAAAVLAAPATPADPEGGPPVALIAAGACALALLGGGAVVATRLTTRLATRRRAKAPTPAAR